ncbi:hypothetical protein V1477_016210 [Vespula maculifrons]|uniref:Uncharacterized protein n=1 Tax=Vespula maculifrons TaxID=7453 RepID=A0ABD2BCD9_VESMC
MREEGLTWVAFEERKTEHENRAAEQRTKESTERLDLCQESPGVGRVNANDVHASADAQRKHNSALQYTDLRDQRIAVQKMIALRYTMSEEFDAFPMENLSSV